MKKCTKCNIDYDDTKIYCVNCGSLLKTVDSAQSSSTSKKIISFCLIVSLVLNLCLGILAYNINRKRAIYVNKYYNALNKYNAIEDSYTFYDKYARIIPDDGSNTYHRYGCEKLNTTKFNIYNLGAAKTHANPCQICCKDD